jgi:addiction module RelE/StbE family toxin
MRYLTSKLFIKHFDKLPINIQDKVNDAIDDFKDDPNQPHLRNHKLKGKLKNTWSISAGGDNRIHYQKLRNSDIIILFIDVGTHSQLY